MLTPQKACAMAVLADSEITAEVSGRSSLWLMVVICIWDIELDYHVAQREPKHTKGHAYMTCRNNCVIEWITLHVQVNAPTSFEDSVGEPVPLPLSARLALGGCWRPTGRVSETFREIYPIVLKVAKTHLESPEDVVLGCYMLGRSSRTAVPYVSFASRDPKYRRELRKLIQKEVLQTYTGWKSVDWNQDPGSRNMTACGSEDHDTANRAPILRIQSSTSDFGGSKILLLRKNRANEI
ncbi:hypothetical protein ACJZ2D_016588 [Fusarium nematophilum]